MKECEKSSTNLLKTQRRTSTSSAFTPAPYRLKSNRGKELTQRIGIPEQSFGNEEGALDSHQQGVS